MCGLVGAVGNIDMKRERIMRDMLILDSVRGIDSTGIAVVPKAGGEVKMAKHVGDPFQLFDTSKWNRALAGTHRAIIGHNRFGTVGRPSQGNAHPFEMSTIVGAHNGTLKDKHRIPNANWYGTDSEALYAMIDDNGLDEALKILDGAWALTWWDKVEGTINFLRNKERPLWLAKTENGDTMFWASERWMIAAATSRHELFIPFDNYFELPVDSLHTFEVDMKGGIGKARVRPAASKIIPFVQGSYQGGYFSHQQRTVTPAPVGGGLKLVAKETPAEKQQSGTAQATASSPANVERLVAHPYNKGEPVLVELKGLGQDSNGGTYVVCSDTKNREAPIRLYYKKTDVVQYHANKGKHLNVKIKEFATKGSYFKVDANSYKTEELYADDGRGAMPLPPGIVESDIAEEEETIVDDFVVKGPRGEWINTATWKAKYGECCVCSDDLDPLDLRNLYTKTGEGICNSCGTSDAWKEYVA